MSWFPWVIGSAAASGVGLLAWAVREAKGHAGGKVVSGGPTMTGGRATPQGRVYVRDGMLHGPVGDPYRLTSADMLWLGRAIVGETGGRSERAAAAVTWALAQNMKLRCRPLPPTSFTTIVRSYCQPVNPKWASLTASGCRSRPEACTPAHLTRRARYASMTWDSLPATTKRVVEQFRAGNLDNPVVGIIDWAAYRYSGDQVNIEGNWFGITLGKLLVGDPRCTRYS